MITYLTKSGSRWVIDPVERTVRRNGGPTREFKRTNSPKIGEHLAVVYDSTETEVAWSSPVTAIRRERYG